MPVLNLGRVVGERGPQGIPGPQGEQGIQGVAGPAGKDGVDGENGAPGKSATIEIGTVTTGEPGTEASVSNSGSANDAVFNFTIPRGEKGERGDQGPAGPTGPEGAPGKDGAPGSGKRVVRIVVGTSSNGWTSSDCDYLCDGTNDEVEINAAIQALPSGGGEVVLLDGTYIISSAILIGKEKVSLVGNGKNTVLQRNWGGENFLEISGIVETNSLTEGSVISNLYFNGKYDIFENSADHCIYIKDSKYCIIENCYFYNCAGGCVLSSSGQCIVKCNVGYQCNNDCISLGNSYGNIISGNFSSYCDNGVNISGQESTNNVISGNVLVNTTNAGIRSANNANNNNISCNVCSNGERGISVDLSKNDSITGNVCNNNSVVGIGYHGQNSTISGNTTVCGSGTPEDYQSSQKTISVSGNNNLISGNNIMGKNYESSFGSGNTFVNNKYN